MWECLAIIPYPPLWSLTKSTLTWLHSGCFVQFLVDGQKLANWLISHLASILLVSWCRISCIKRRSGEIFIYTSLILNDIDIPSWNLDTHIEYSKMTPSFEAEDTFTVHYFTNNPSSFWILPSFVEFRVFVRSISHTKHPETKQKSGGFSAPAPLLGELFSLRRSSRECRLILFARASRSASLESYILRS